MERPGAFVGGWVAAALALVAVTGCTPDDPRAEDASAIIEQLVSDDLPGCSAAAAVRGAVVWADHKGLANVVAEVPMESSTRFNFGSVSMQFTATAVLALAEAGELNLDDTVADHIDGLPAWGSAVTVGDLIHHTSGLRDAELLTLDTGTQEEYLRVLREGEGYREDATEYGYADTNYVLLAIIAEEVSGSSLSGWLAENVFDPLGLALDLELHASGDQFATGYEEEAAPFREAEEVTQSPGPSSILGTPSELARWGDHYRGSSVPSQESLDAALGDAAEILDSAGAHYGPGIGITSSGGLIHEGYDAGIFTFFGVSEDRETTLVVSCNAPLSVLDDLYGELIDVWLGDRFLA